jgi:hypothetical protein
VTQGCPLLAVAVEIQAAIIEGLITGAVLLGGVLLSEWLIRQRERRARLEHAVHRLTLLVPVVLTYLSTTPPDSLRLDAGSAGWYFQQEMLDSLFEADLLVRHSRSHAYSQIREALDELSAKISDATSRGASGQYLSATEIAQISTDTLTDAVHGRRKTPYGTHDGQRQSVRG